MKFHPVTSSMDESEDGAYQLKRSDLPGRGSFWNAWHVESNKHVGAGHKRKDVIEECKAHAQRAQI